MIHSDNIVPFFGVIEDVNHDQKNGRYRVRIYGYNSSNSGVLPTDMLKWFPTINPNSASMDGIGVSPTGYLVGTFVFGVYLDRDLQEGLILGAIAGDGDVSEIATGEGGQYVEALKKNLAQNVVDARGETWSEPATKYATQYPNNRVLQTKSGHVVEFDDTPGAERVVIFHKSGTFQEMHPDGKRVNKSVGQVFEVCLGGQNIFVNGNVNLVATGDYRVSVGGEYYLKASNVVFDVPVMDVYGISNAIDHVSSNVSGATHVHDGVMPGPYQSGTPYGMMTMFSPTPANNFYISVEDTGYTPEVIEFALKEGFMTEEEVKSVLESEPIIDSVDETPTEQVRSQIVECGLALDQNGQVDYNVRLSENFILRDVSLGAVVSQYAIRDQVGLTKEEIICNLKNLCENVLEPIKKKYPNMIVTSAFRAGSGTSQHLKGEAVDIQFRNATKNFYYEAAQWIKNNVPYDQLLFEGKSTGTKLPWIHISLVRSRKQRYQIMTFFNHRKVADGLVKLE